MGDGEMASVAGSNGVFVSQLPTKGAPTTQDAGTLRKAPNFLSNVAGPALRTLNSAENPE